MDKIIQGKRNKLLKSGRTEEGWIHIFISIIILASIYYNLNIPEINITPEDILEEERKKIPDVTDATALVQIPTQHPFPSASYSIVELPPNTSSEYKIYRDLWNKGYFITEGHTFGGDFLLYPGDPVYFHASHIVHILDSPFVPSKTVSCNCRLSVNVNKTCLYAYLNPENNSIVYQSVKWKSDVRN